ncbi:uncharacterized protein LOC131596667 [Vicia villosa]|uniref:uncharacterized protein LOC131596667 n=1 Tax=Vicia villosa TaxID=3911 RepID=UPI00273C9F14|nr:uncharacterized protein LOC131596667 [Vicia villosa]
MSSTENNTIKASSRVTWEGCSVVLDIDTKNGHRLDFARLTPAASLSHDHKNYSLKPLIGCPFGTVFQLDTSSDHAPFLSPFQPKGNNVNNIEEIKDDRESRDNRSLIDNNTAQTLTAEDIQHMRRQGAKGDDIVEAVIANSATFHKKTSFSQEKYIDKKQKKHAPRVLMRRPVARSICEAYIKKNLLKIGFLRVDTLSLLLSMANVSSNSDVLVVDMVGGLLTGAVAERLGGTGFVCNSYLGQTPHAMDIVNLFNLSDEIRKRIVRSSISDLLSPKESPQQNSKQDVGSVESQSIDQMSVSVSMEEASRLPENRISDLGAENTTFPVLKAHKAIKAGEKASQEILNSWKENGFSSLIIAALDLDTWTVVRDLLPLLSNSAPFAIYHQYLQPLATCMHNLQLEKLAIGLQITEPWLREYQVLPSRTHPHMKMSAFGGYILSGTKICSS